MSTIVWSLSATDPETGTRITLLITREDDRMGVLVQSGRGTGPASRRGLLLDRHEAQQVRHAVTSYLVDAAPQVTS